MALFPIADPNDPRLAPYTRIRERDLTGRGDRFIVEGKVTLEILLTRSRFAVESLFLCETRLQPLAGLLAQVPADVPVYTAPQALMDTVAGFPMHRGVLACGWKGPGLQTADLLRGETRRFVGAVGLANHDNVGALFRNAAAFGAQALLMDEECCDPLYRKAIRVSAGTSLWLPYARGGSALDMVNALKTAGYAVWALTPQTGAASLWTQPVPERLAILVGAEGPGLPSAVIDAATPIRIPMTEGIDSVNVATAAAIALAHLFRPQTRSGASK